MKETWRHTGSPRFRDRRHARMSASRPADRPVSQQASDAVSRFAPKDDGRGLIDRILECFSRCRSGDICSLALPRTWPRIIRKSAIGRLHPPRKPALYVRKRTRAERVYAASRTEQPRGIERALARSRARARAR